MPAPYGDATRHLTSLRPTAGRALLLTTAAEEEHLLKVFGPPPAASCSRTPRRPAHRRRRSVPAGASLEEEDQFRYLSRWSPVPGDEASSRRLIASCKASATSALRSSATKAFRALTSETDFS